MVNPSVLAAAKQDTNPPPAKKTKVMEVDNVEVMRKKREAKVSGQKISEKYFVKFLENFDPEKQLNNFVKSYQLKCDWQNSMNY